MTAASIPSFVIWMIFVLPMVGALVTAALGKVGRLRDYTAVGFSLLSSLSALTLLLPVLQGRSISVYNSIIPQSVPWISPLGLTMGVLSDPYTAILTNVIGWVSFLIMVYCLEYMKGDSGATRFFFFMDLFIGSMQLIILSDNLLALFVGWEMVGLCSYALIGHYYRDETKDWVGTPGDKALGEDQAYPPSHAGMKAFVMTRIGDVAMLAGILILFFYAGTFNYYQLASTSSSWAPRLSSAGLLVPVALLIFGGAIGKSAQFPLHEWLPDAMAGPAPVSALIHAATMVKAGVVLVARIAPLFYFAFVLDPAVIQPFFLTVAWIGAFTAFLAATQALVGYELKKILAYSTVSQIGYMMLAMGLAGLTPDFAAGLSAGLYHLISHAIFKACLFLTAGALIHAADSKYINEMGGLRDKMKITFAAFLIAAASLSGIPPFSGFWSKDAILGVSWGAGQYGLFIVGAATAGLTAFYSFRMLGMVFFGKRSQKLSAVEESGHHVHEPGPLMWVPYSLLAVATVLIGLVALAGEVIPSLNIQTSLESAAATYVAGLFPSQSVQAMVAPAAFDASSSGITGLFVAVGFLVAAGFYIARRMDPAAFIGERGIMRGLYTFLEKRWYINAIYYKVFVTAPISASRWLNESLDSRGLFQVNYLGSALGLSLSRASNWVDARVVDGTANGISTFGQAISRGIRRIQTGITEEYMQVFALGIIVMVLLFLLALGVGLP